MKKSETQSNRPDKHGAEKPISLAPLTEAQALRGLLSVKPMKSDELKKVSKKRTAKASAKK